MAIAAAGLAAGGAVGVPAAAGAASGQGLVVSVPAGPVTAQPGGVVHTDLRIGNTSAQPMTVHVSVGGVRFGSDGSATVTDQPDPEWANRLTLATTSLVVPAASSVVDAVTALMPAHAAPNDYFVGFLVSRAVTRPGNVDVVTRIAALLDLQVPGPRHSQLRLVSVTMPSVLTGSRLRVTAVVYNPGRTFVTVWGEVHLSPFASATQIVTFPGRTTVAPGQTRTLQATADVGAGIGPVDAHTFVFFNTRPSTVAQLEGSGTAWLVNPPELPAVPMALLLAALAVWLRGRRRRRRSNTAAPGRPNTGNRWGRGPAVVAGKSQ